MTKHARFLVDPEMLLGPILPPGNKVTGLAVTPAGMLVVQFTGVDAPKEAEGEPIMLLMCERDAQHVPSYWLEIAPPIYQGNRKRRGRKAVRADISA